MGLLEVCLISLTADPWATLEIIAKEALPASPSGTPVMRHVFISLLLVVTALHGTVASAATLTAEFVDAKGKPLSNAVLTLHGATSPPEGSLKADMDQRDVQFAPRVLAVRTGTKISFPNSDQIRHQVYSFSTPKRFELRLYGGTPSDPVLFDKPGVVVLGCNVHDNMIGYVYVTDDGWFGVSSDKGTLTLDQVPAGHYSVTLWHPEAPDMLPVSGGDIDIPAGGLKQRFSIAVQPGADATPAAPPSSAFGDAFHKAAHE